MSRSLKLIALLLWLSSPAFAQPAPGCPQIEAGSPGHDTISLPCGTPCTDLLANGILETGATTSYGVSSIPYAPPFPFTGGTQLFVGQDDIYSGAVNLPFDFCFFGQSYSQVVIGANGNITFDITQANGFNNWAFTDPCPNPNLPLNSIFGAYHDIEPNSNSDISFAILGTAPCQTFVVSYNGVPQFDCTNLTTTQQIVIYETTNVVEVYIQDKPVCNTWNSGNSLIGVQNAAGNTGYTPAARNTGAWGATNEAWRFTPNGTANWGITWYDGGGNQVGTGDSINVCPTSTTMYVAEVSYNNCNGNTITVSDTVTVALGSTLTHNITTVDATCGSSDGSITITVNGGTPPYQYSIDGGVTFQASGTFNNLSAGNYNIEIQDAGGCTVTDVAVVGQVGGITIDPNVTLTPPSCGGLCDGSLSFTVTGGFPPLQYSIDNGTTLQPTSTFNNLCAGDYYLYVIDNSGCFDTDTVTLTEPTPVVLSLPSDTIVCPGNLITLTASASGGVGGYTFAWQDQGGVITQGPSVQFTATTPTSYTVVVTDANGCTDGPQVINVDLAGQVTVTALSSQSICPGLSAQVSALALNGDGNYTYTWTDGNGFSQTGQSINLSPTVTTTYTVDVIDGCGTTAQDQLTITVLPTPVVTFTGTNLSGCAPITSYFANTTDPNMVGGFCTWDFGDGNFGTGCLVDSHFYDVPGLYDVTLTVISPDGCEGSTTMTQFVDVWPNPNASFNYYPQPANIVDPEVNFISTSTDAAFYTWIWDSIVMGTDSTITIDFPNDEPGDYTVCLAVESDRGCVDTTCQQVIVNGVLSIFVPNAFTPNGDGINDFFYVKGDGFDLSDFEFSIFNRWGNLIFDTESPYKPWDGKYGGVESPIGVYVWKLKVKDKWTGEPAEYYGHVTIVR